MLSAGAHCYVFDPEVRTGEWYSCTILDGDFGYVNTLGVQMRLVSSTLANLALLVSLAANTAVRSSSRCLERDQIGEWFDGMILGENFEFVNVVLIQAGTVGQ